MEARIVGAAMAFLLAAPLASADEYQFEAGLGVFGERFEADALFALLPSPFIVTSSADIDTDEVGVFGNWYVNGLSDDDGPRARAAFVDRASVVSFGYSRAETTAAVTVTSDDPNFVPTPSPNLSIDIDLVGVNGTFISKDSGWFGQVGLARTDLSSNLIGSADATTFVIGAGKYLLDTTALAVTVGQTDADGGDATTFSAAFTHLGAINESWQFAIDLEFNVTDTDAAASNPESWRAGLAFYPGRNLEFGIAFDGDDGVSGLGSDRTGIEGFGSWFISPKFQVSAGYRVDDVDNELLGSNIGPANGADQYAFNIGAAIRF